jgi:hypothetical protein
MAAHLRKATAVGAFATNKNRLNRGLHVVVVAAPAGTFDNANARSWASNTISCVSRGYRRTESGDRGRVRSAILFFPMEGNLQDDVDFRKPRSSFRCQVP